jgi:plasmid maintenance system killer protein
MIVNFRDDWLRAFFVDDIRSRNIPSDLESRVFRKLQMIDDATTDQDLRVPPSNHFEKLRGKTGRSSFDPRQSAMAPYLQMGWRPGRSNRRLSRRPQL